MMTFGLFLSFMQIYEEQRGLDMYKNMLELAILADDLGIRQRLGAGAPPDSLHPAPNALLGATQVGQYVKNATVGTASSPSAIPPPPVNGGRHSRHR